MPELDLILDAKEPIWPELGPRLKSGRVYHVTQKMYVAFLAGGMKSGNASVVLRFDLPDGKVVIAETSLRTFWQAARQGAIRHGESFMRDQPVGDVVLQKDLAIKHLTEQLFACQVRHGEEPLADLSGADAEWDALVKARKESTS